MYNIQNFLHEYKTDVIKGFIYTKVKQNLSEIKIK